MSRLIPLLLCLCLWPALLLARDQSSLGERDAVQQQEGDAIRHASHVSASR